MAKTNKELTAEIVSTYIQAWFSSSRTAAMKANDVADIIAVVYDAIAGLPDEPEHKE